MEPIQLKTNVDQNGYWRLDLDVNNLIDGLHTVVIKDENGNTYEAGVFYKGENVKQKSSEIQTASSSVNNLLKKGQAISTSYDINFGLLIAGLLMILTIALGYNWWKSKKKTLSKKLSTKVENNKQKIKKQQILKTKKSKPQLTKINTQTSNSDLAGASEAFKRRLAKMKQQQNSKNIKSNQTKAQSHKSKFRLAIKWSLFKQFKQLIITKLKLNKIKLFRINLKFDLVDLKTKIKSFVSFKFNSKFWRLSGLISLIAVLVIITFYHYSTQKIVVNNSEPQQLATGVYRSADIYQQRNYGQEINKVSGYIYDFQDNVYKNRLYLTLNDVTILVQNGQYEFFNVKLGDKILISQAGLSWRFKKTITNPDMDLYFDPILFNRLGQIFNYELNNDKANLANYYHVSLRDDFLNTGEINCILTNQDRDVNLVTIDRTELISVFTSKITGDKFYNVAKIDIDAHGLIKTYYFVNENNSWYLVY